MTQGKGPPESIVSEIFPGVYLVPDPKNSRKRLIATKNITPGRQYYGEGVVRTNIGGVASEFRLWDPFRSKLSAAILKGLISMPFREGTFCVYLGASTGTTVSHISDLVGESGRIFAVEMAPRVSRELLENVVRFRRNIVPIIADARRPELFASSTYGEIQIVYCDIAQPDQTEIAITNCERFFNRSRKGTLILVVKASSIDATRDKLSVFEEQGRILKRAGYEIKQKIDLEPYDRNHQLVVSERARNP